MRHGHRHQRDSSSALARWRSARVAAQPEIIGWLNPPMPAKTSDLACSGASSATWSRASEGDG